MGPVIIHVSLLSDLSLQGAKVIITVVFSATRYSDVAKQQIFYTFILYTFILVEQMLLLELLDKYSMVVNLCILCSNY